MVSYNYKRRKSYEYHTKQIPKFRRIFSNSQRQREP